MKAPAPGESVVSMQGPVLIVGKAFSQGVAFDSSAAIESIKSKASTLPEIARELLFYVQAPTSYDEKASAQLAKGRDNLKLVMPVLEAAGTWDAETIKASVQHVADQSGKKLGELMPPMRAAIVGAMSGPDIPVAMAILGKEESLKRLKAAAEA